jgi:hypothetical protein
MSASPIPPRADSPPPNLADAKARFSQSWDIASKVSAPPELEQAPLPCPPGFVVWRIKGSKAVTMLPQLLPHAPVRVRRKYAARVISTLTGRCPLCGGVAWIDTDAPDPETHPAGWARLDVTVGVVHTHACSGTFLEKDRRFFDERAIPR